MIITVIPIKIISTFRALLRFLVIGAIIITDIFAGIVYIVSPRVFCIIWCGPFGN